MASLPNYMRRYVTSLWCCVRHAHLRTQIRDSVTVIIHNAWRLDFNLSLVSLEPNIEATRNLVNLALDAKYRSSLRFVFTSSIGTAQSWDRTQGAFPEELSLDPSTAVGSGYGESKYVCERVRSDPFHRVRKPFVTYSFLYRSLPRAVSVRRH